jgi:tetratricopeptide (TPR) repeat protein
MPRKISPSAASSAILESAATPIRTRLAAGTLGQAGSRDTLAQLTAAMADLKAMAIQPMLQQAVNAIQAERHAAGAEWALKALGEDEHSGFAWYLLGIALERLGDFKGSITAYEAALKLLPDHAEVANDLGRLAFRLDMKPQAEKLFRHFLARHPDHHEGANNLACAVRDQNRLEEAVEILKPAILKRPETPMLWNTMGTVVAEQGDFENSEVFFHEALRLQPDFPKAQYNLGNTRLSLGDAEGALAACDAALAGVTAEDERQMMRLARSTILITLGRIAEGWDEYEARFNPHFADVTQMLVDRPRWEPGADLAGKSLLVIGEQGLGDEVLFANTLPDVLERLGPSGKLYIALEPRLIPLFQRAFPTAKVGAHATFSHAGRSARIVPFIEDPAAVDLWTPMGSLLREYRASIDAFPARERYLTADPARVAHWRAALKAVGAGPKVGLLWKSAVKTSGRHRHFAGFQDWAPALRVPGVCFVNLQYGDCAEELEMARREYGVEFWAPPGIDLKQDLDDVAALCCAMDLVVGFSNATFNIAAACGAPTWLLTGPGVWPRLGCADRYPWYPQTRVLSAQTYGDWGPVMTSLAEAMADHFKLG